MANPLTIETGTSFTIPGTTITIVWTGDPISSALLTALFTVFGELVGRFLGPLTEIWSDISSFLHLCPICDVLDAIFGEGRISKEKHNIQKFFTPFFEELHAQGWTNDRGSHFDEHADAERDLRQDSIVWDESQRALRLDTPMIMNHMFGSDGPTGFDERFTYQYWDNAWGDGWSTAQRVSAWNIMIVAMGLTPRGWPIINVGVPGPIDPDPEVIVGCSPECVEVAETVRRELHALIGTVQFVWIPTLQSQITSISGQVANIDFSKLPKIQGDVGNVQGRVGVIENQSLPYVQQQVNTQAARTNVLEIDKVPRLETSAARSSTRIDNLESQTVPQLRSYVDALNREVGVNEARQYQWNSGQDAYLNNILPRLSALEQGGSGEDGCDPECTRAIAESESRQFARTQELHDYNRSFTTPKVLYLESQNLALQTQTIPNLQRDLRGLNEEVGVRDQRQTDWNRRQDGQIQEVDRRVLEIPQAQASIWQPKIDQAVSQARACCDSLNTEMGVRYLQLINLINSSINNFSSQIQTYITNYVASQITNNNNSFFITIQNYVTTTVQTCCDRVVDGAARGLECLKVNLCSMFKATLGMGLECYFEDHTKRSDVYKGAWDGKTDFKFLYSQQASLRKTQRTGPLLAAYQKAKEADRLARSYKPFHTERDEFTMPLPEGGIFAEPDGPERETSNLVIRQPALLPQEADPCASS